MTNVEIQVGKRRSEVQKGKNKAREETGARSQADRRMRSGAEKGARLQGKNEARSQG